MPCKYVLEDGTQCKNAPLYNTPGNKPLYCRSHKTDDMICVQIKRCECILDDGTTCEVTASYGFPNQKIKQRCSKHKLDGMIDLKHPRCMHEGCQNDRSCGYPTDTKVLYCVAHKREGMIDKKHIYCNCGLAASYNYNNTKTPLYCKSHKLENMVDVTHRRCENEDCIRRPLYNYLNEKRPRFCCSHKLNGMFDISNKKCLSEWCDNRCYSKRYEGYCTFCFVNLFPEKPISCNYRTKEKTIRDFVVENFPNMSWIHDKRVQDGCSRRRPDLLLDLGYQVIIVEIDENQHIDYDCSCENKRLMEISQDVGHRNIIFIRFNPDDYVDEDSKYIECVCGETITD